MIIWNEDSKRVLKDIIKFLKQQDNSIHTALSGKVLRKKLAETLNYLNTYACHSASAGDPLVMKDEPEDTGIDRHKTHCELFGDFAPLSFSFVMKVRGEDGKYKYWFNGGVIFHGPHDGFGNGGAPTFAVSLTPTVGWQIHT